MTVAKSLEGANLVWQRVNEFMLTVDSAPVSRAAFLRSLKQWLATQRGNPKLQYLSFAALTADDVATVPELSTGGCTLYALFAQKKSGTSTTEAIVKLNDSATVAGGASGANEILAVPLKNSKDSVSVIFEPGLPIVTGIRLSGSTTVAGDVATSAADEANGFLIVG